MNTPFNDLESTLQRYVLGKLTEAEAEEFEAYYLPNPELIEQVETAQRMALGLENNVAQAPNHGEQDRGSIIQTLIKWLSFPVPAFSVIAAAAVIAPLAINFERSAKNAGQIALVNFSTSATRGLERVQSIDLRNDSVTTAVMIKLRTVGYAKYKLKVFENGADTPVWTSNEFRVSALRDKLIVIPEQAKISNATLEVVGIGQDLQESTVEFCHYSEVCR